MNLIIVLGKKGIGSLAFTAAFEKFSQWLVVAALVAAAIYTAVAGAVWGLPGILSYMSLVVSMLMGSLIPLLILNVGLAFSRGWSLPFAKERGKERDIRAEARFRIECVRLRETVTRICGLGPAASPDAIVQCVATAMGLHNTVARLETRLAELKALEKAETTIAELERKLRDTERARDAAKTEASNLGSRVSQLSTEKTALEEKSRKERLGFEHQLAELTRRLEGAQTASVRA